VAWTAVLRLSVQILQFVSIVVLARLLSPSDFGLATIALTIAGFAFFLNDFGITSTVVSTPHLTRGVLNAAFFLNAAVGILLTLSLIGMSPLFASVYGDNRLQGLIAVSALAFAANQAAVPMGLLIRFGRLRAVGLIEVLGAAASLGTSVGASLLGAGVYALVFGPVCGSVVVSITSNVVARYRPNRSVLRADIRYVASSGAKIFIYDTINYGAINADRPLIGLSASFSELGLYSRASSLTTIPASILNYAASRTLLPQLVSLRESSRSPNRTWLTYVRYTLGASAMVSLFLSLNASDVLTVVLGSRWELGRLYLPALALAIPFIASRSLCAPLLQSQGLLGKQVSIAAVALASLALVVLVAMQAGGTVLASWGVLGSAAVSSAFAARQVARSSRLSAVDIIRAASTGLIAGAAAPLLAHWATQVLGPSLPFERLLLNGVMTVMIGGAIALYIRRRGGIARPLALDDANG
jgi:PST family polysaccharide transporter